MESFGEPLLVQDVSDPACPADGALVRVEACGICRSDWHVWLGHWPDLDFPLIMGHELAGTVEEVAPGVAAVTPGDRVIVPFCGGCGGCEWCLAGHHNVCDAPFSPGFTSPGGFGRYAPVTKAGLNLVPLPDAIDFVTATAMGCRYMTAFHGVANIGQVAAGEWLAVHGCGGVGLSAVQIANALGAQVIAVDIDSQKLDMAAANGASHKVNASNCDPAEAIHEITKGGAQVSIDALGVATTCRNSVRSLRKRGRHVQIGITAPDQKGECALPTDDIMGRELQILGSHGMPLSSYSKLLDLVTAGKLDPKRLVTRTVPLDATPVVLESMENFETAGFVVIDSYEPTGSATA